MKYRLAFASDAGELSEVRHVARTFLDENGFDESDAELLVLALDEACTNIIRHAYRQARKPVRLEMTRLRNRVRFVLRDYGQSCDPKRIRSRDLKDVRPGGVGVHIIKEVFDTVKYEPQPRGTKLTLEKNLPKNPAS